MWWKRWVVPIERRTVGTDDFLLITHVDENVGMIEGRLGANALEFLCPDVYGGNPSFVVVFGGEIFSHSPTRSAVPEGLGDSTAREAMSIEATGCRGGYNR